MEVIIKNTTDKRQKAVVFGFNYSLCPPKTDDYSFFDISTNDGVEIYYDGLDISGCNSILEDKMKFLKNEKIPFVVDEFEYYSDKNTVSYYIYYFSKDANGSIQAQCILPQSFIEATQQNLFPIIIKKRIGIDHNSSLLFILQPHEEIKLIFEKLKK